MADPSRREAGLAGVRTSYGDAIVPSATLTREPLSTPQAGDLEGGGYPSKRGHSDAGELLGQLSEIGDGRALDLHEVDVAEAL